MSRLDFYIEEISKMQRPEDGWVLDGHIDGDALMFNAMLFAAQRNIPDNPLMSVNLLSAISQEGKVYRKPISSGNAYPTLSKSEISRDMILGLVFGLEVGGCEYRKGIARIILNYSNNKFGVLGRGLYSRTRMTFNLRTLLRRISGQRRWYDVYIPSIPMDGYRAHLDVLSIYLRWCTGRLGFMDRYRLRRYAKKQNNNALFIIINNIVNGLEEEFNMDVSMFPMERLPSSKDRKTNYLWQRNQGSADWYPLNDVSSHVHIPFDYLIVTALWNKHFSNIAKVIPTKYR